jgi:hypothetical protein
LWPSARRWHSQSASSWCSARRAAAFGSRSTRPRGSISLIFLPAYAGGAIAALFGNAFASLRDNGRNFGLAFAAALTVHLGLVVCLCATGEVPDAKIFVVFGAAAILTYVLALLSLPRVRQALLIDFGRRFGRWR